MFGGLFKTAARISKLDFNIDQVNIILHAFKKPLQPAKTIVHSGGHLERGVLGGRNNMTQAQRRQ